MEPRFILRVIVEQFPPVYEQTQQVLVLRLNKLQFLVAQLQISACMRIISGHVHLPLYCFSQL